MSRSADLEDPAFPHGLKLSRYRDMRHPRPAFEGSSGISGRCAAIIGGATRFGSATVQLATTLQRPLLEEFDRVHRAADFSRPEFIIHQERWVKPVGHSFLHPAASPRPESKNPPIVEGRPWRCGEDIGMAGDSVKTLLERGQK